MRKLLVVICVIIVLLPVFAPAMPVNAQEEMNCLPEGAPTPNGYDSARISLRIGDTEVTNNTYWYRVNGNLPSTNGCSVTGTIASAFNSQLPEFTNAPMFIMMRVGDQTQLSIGSTAFLNEMGFQMYNGTMVSYTLLEAEDGWWDIDTFSTGIVVATLNEPTVSIRFEPMTQ